MGTNFYGCTIKTWYGYKHPEYDLQVIVLFKPIFIADGIIVNELVPKEKRKLIINSLENYQSSEKLKAKQLKIIERLELKKE